MQLEWWACLFVAGFIYINSEDIFPGSWLTNNMWMDFHDKYPYHVNKKMHNNPAVIPRKYTQGATNVEWFIFKLNFLQLINVNQ